MSSKLLCGHSARPWVSVVVLMLGCAVVLAWWLERGLAVTLPQTLSQPTQALPCVSYAPFRHPDINPFNHSASVTAAQIEADLRLLLPLTNCIRTYGLTQGLDAVPAVARKLKMRVKLGVWVARDAAQNQAQLRHGLDLARRYPDVIELLIVGNEVLLRKELTATQLAQLLSQAKAQSSVPVTYADVWEFWQRHAALAQAVDVVTVHILPYWEDQSVAVHAAAEHVQAIGRKLQQQFAGKPVWIGETGWPAAGRQRGAAVPGTVEQSAFMRDLLRLRPAIAQEFNVIEAFDQPWKRSFEGAMGGYWGLFDAQGRARVRLSGPVVEDAQWWHGLVGAGLGAALITALGLLLPSRARLGCPKAALIGFWGGGLLGAVCAVHVLMMSWWDRSPFETAVSIGLGVVGAAATVLNLIQLLGAGARLGAVAAATRLVLLFCAASAALIVLLDPRYRPFPWWWFLAPTFSWLALLYGTPPERSNDSRQTQFLAVALAVFAVGIMLQEGWRNAQALCYGALLCTLAGVALWPSLAKTKAASSAAGAHSSVE